MNVVLSEVDESPELAAVEFETVTVSAVVLMSDDVVMTVDTGLVVDWQELVVVGLVVDGQKLEEDVPGSVLVVDISVWLLPTVLVSFIVVNDVVGDTDVGVCVLVDETSVEAELDIVDCDVIPTLPVVVADITVVVSEELLMADVVSV